ncbi:hypothetical protein [Oscillatoria salina]|uniref:hypothetical protein n=1 Tax=Oscillatoria salina TaxID=331517 RepID=UPI0013B6051B|nr:hypothetical protein [Oscillatoria salina]MBZ8182922.1 hypothetical protein [Oscillatoria salina IIICB1]NET86571.1 hypothetical protein [Kamptonema sp. SIO1D9]
MRGWKVIERKIEQSVSLAQAHIIIEDAGFTEYFTNSEHTIFKRAGKQLAIDGKNFSLEVTLAKMNVGLFFRIRYDTFVLFDTGDLEKLADELVAKLKV